MLLFWRRFEVLKDFAEKKERRSQRPTKMASRSARAFACLSETARLVHAHAGFAFVHPSAEAPERWGARASDTAGCS
jgi:hypothetical protein